MCFIENDEKQDGIGLAGTILKSINKGDDMKKIVMVLFLGLAIFIQLYPETAKDYLDVIRTCAIQGYVGASFSTDAKAMAESVHPKLTKFRVRSPITVNSMTQNDLVNNQIKTAKKNKFVNWKKLKLKYEVLDLTKNIAAVKVENFRFWDLIFLTKHDSQWLVTNVVWDLPNTAEAGTEKELVKTVEDYLTAIYKRDIKTLDKILHPRLDMRKALTKDSVDSVGKEWLIEQVKNKRWKKLTKKELNIEISVLDIHKSYASVKVSSAAGTEYLHLKYFENQWYLINGLWERNSSN